MATSTKTKNGSTSRSTARKSAPRSTASRRPTSRRSARSRISEMPGWAATIASVVGVGVAVGVGLFATRHQWLPKAEEWGDQLASRFRHQNDDDDYDADLDGMADEDEEWDGKVSRAAYPDRDIYSGAQAVS